MQDKIKKWHAQGLWSAAMVAQAVAHGVLTQAQCDAILEAPPTGAESEATP